MCTLLLSFTPWRCHSGSLHEHVVFLATGPDLLFSNQSHHMQNSSFMAPPHAEKWGERLDDLICTYDVLCVVGIGRRRSLDTRLQNSRTVLISAGTLRQNGAQQIQILAETNSRKVGKNKPLCMQYMNNEPEEMDKQGHPWRFQN